MTGKADRLRELTARVEELEARLERSEKTVRALRDVGLALGSTLDLDQLLELILGKITELLEADRATLYLLDEQRKMLLSRVILGGEVRSIELPVGEGIAGHVAKHGKIARVKDAYRDKRFQRTWDELTGYRTRSILAAPMRNHVGRTIGVVQVLNKHGGKGEFSQHDEELLSALATQAAISIDNSRLFLSVIQKNMQLVETKEQLEHRVADLKLLFELETAMSGASSLEELSRAVIAEASKACEARAGGLLVDEGEAGVFLYFCDASAPGVSVRDVDVKRLPVKRGEGLLGWAMTHNESVHLGPKDPPIGPIAEAALTHMHPSLDLEIESAIVVPLEGEEDTSLGALGLYNAKNALGFTQDDRSLLRLVSANASTAVRLFRSRTEREKSERLTAIGRLLSGVMHDMRTPLTVISGYVQLMATAGEPSVRAEHARLILKQFDAISAMQRELLEFARGERSILVRKVYLTKFFGDLEKQLQLDLAGNRVTIVMELDDRGTARFDETKMTRVVHNLVRNAVEAMEPHGGGKVVLRALRQGSDFVLSVSDTGRGIPPEIRERLFHSFVTSGKRGGTGLGLAIVKKIVDEHGGSIEVDSSERGTTFTIRIPQETPLTATIAPPAPHAPHASPHIPRASSARVDEATGLPLVHATSPASASAAATTARSPQATAAEEPEADRSAKTARASQPGEEGPPSRRSGRTSNPGQPAGRTG
ncbi:GAF domain-containing protein [Polyangium sp. y55x31]|uniref:GAF domain-containing protein n=1 Tax=Polyangium sp. y55x31 TaxID=3042688 RepID=UPI0024824983|nr:GAF domain-containing protein [Polyangium sp. y55x31]MDI1480589.1 GAF domain-containing protein [Polyangium sp. y55x31]